MMLDLQMVAILPHNTERTPTRDDVAETVRKAADMGTPWVLVARPDRYARAETMVARINDGREYGKGFAAVIRKIGPEIRVYASYVGRG